MSQVLTTDRDLVSVVDGHGNGEAQDGRGHPPAGGVGVAPQQQGGPAGAGPIAVQRPCEPAFLVGITGLMDLDCEAVPALKERVRQILRFLRWGINAIRPAAGSAADPALELLLQFVPPDARSDPRLGALRGIYRRFFEKWAGLGDTPIVVLSSLAPGADTLVAEVALEKEFRDANISIRAPLPFPAEICREASTFVRGQPAEDAIRQQRYDDLLKKIGLENTFVVRLESDRGRSLADLTRLDKAGSNQFIVDRADHVRRHQRYYAAGEFMANYAHLLIAIWDGRPGDGGVGTGAVVDARLLGPRAGVLPPAESVALPHGGPVWQLVAARRRPGAAAPDEGRTGGDPRQRDRERGSQGDAERDAGRFASGDVAAVTLEGAAMRFLHPVAPAEDGSIPEGYDDQVLDAALQGERLAIFSRIAELLRRYNEDCERKPVGRTKSIREFRDRLKFVPPLDPARRPTNGSAAVETRNVRDENLIRPLRNAAPAFWEALRRVSDLRRQAANANRAHHRSHNLTLVLAFLLTLFAAASLHLFAHWHAADDDSAGWFVTAGSGLLAFLAASFALLFFAWRRSGQAEERAHDQRALAEGLRVQFYWNLAGLGSSVSANYMQRHRSELDWIRAAIRSLTFPYEQWSDWFAELSPQLKTLALRCVARSWIEDQRRYHLQEWKKQAHTLHCWHALGRSSALAGIFTFLMCWAGQTISGAEERLSANRWLLLGLGCSALALWALLVAAVRTRSRGHSEHVPVKHENEVCWQRAVELCLLTGHGPAILPTSSGRHFGLLVKGFICCLPPAIGLALAIYAACLFAAGRAGQAPEALAIICGGWLLLGGAMAVAWAEKNFYSELAYQYHTMESLFGHAAVRIARDLERLEASANDPARHDEFEQIVREVQEFLFSLGKEALDENAEWLLLHRARPLEPVMAG